MVGKLVVFWCVVESSFGGCIRVVFVLMVLSPPKRLYIVFIRALLVVFCKKVVVCLEGFCWCVVVIGVFLFGVYAEDRGGGHIEVVRVCPQRRLLF